MAGGVTEPPAPAAAGRVDRLVVLRAAAYGQLLAMPGALVNSAVSGRDGASDAALALSFLAVVAGFAVAGFAAGRNATHDIARHGAFAGLVAFVPVELLAILGRLDRGDPIRLLTIVVHAAIAASLAMGVARLGARRRSATAATDGAAPAPHPSTTPDREDRS